MIQKYECRLRKAGVLRVADVTASDRFPSADALARVAHALTRGVPHEQVWAILLSGKMGLIGAVRLGEGGISGCALLPADVFRPALVAGASSLVLSHNHPSGDPTPSAADVSMTRALYRVGKLLGVPLLDHLVVTQDAAVYHSMCESLCLFSDEGGED